ncbi:MAG: TonB-dependent receptor, partial [Hymenobacteraceae bacterium]|nr:TonB-dependent receptor [Hymenobacteraceae bacterium]
PSSDQYNECVRAREVGSRLDHARNVLRAKVFSAEIRNSWMVDNRNELQFGFKAGHERIEDKLDEWSFTDSADFVNFLGLNRSDLDLNSMRYNAYVQHTIDLDSLKTLTYGVRASYWTVNKQFTFSPRVQFSFILPNNPDLSFKTAVGYYHQPPFYRELRDRAGNLNPEVRAQQAIHFIAGSEYQFKKWDRPFKLVSEVYYKHLTDVIPYDQDNVRLRYFAKNNAKAYAAGFDVRLNGEFIKGTESWFSLGLLTTKEDIQNDSTFLVDADGNITGKTPIGYIRRPTDQRLTVGVYFEDHIPNNPTLKMYLSLIYGSGLPFNPPGEEAYRGAFTNTRPYIRPDIGFSKLITLRDEKKGKASSLESLWISLEFLNLIDKNNIVSYTYVKDINNITYSVPNYLTGRVINLRFIARF